ncbi:rhomboid family intramembrane serine protease [Nocardioides sp. Y6]|uniref:Rhomboid family intramembrane serine protease n=1 Tax=Nocardioides malaquae TaxID=2773426 RepID=A0ABR9RT35_9ACTN|nr:rhomboid family intramembrane serine protease [Nocardioides malaquae]MBE7324739.1 rhomboid family intramembrane serine protease [Nocardioides malaquae]
MQYYDPRPVRPRPRWQGAAVLSGGFVGLLWVLEVIDLLLLNQTDRLGVRPGSSDGLMGVLFAPLLHSGFPHLANNTVPLLVLGFLVALNGLSRWVAVTVTIWLVSGVGTWLVGGWGSVHIGASGLLFGYLVYLVIRGVVSRRPWQILLGVVVFLVYGSVLWGVLPGTPGISWQMHLFGAVGGGLAAWWLDKPVRRQPRSVY